MNEGDEPRRSMARPGRAVACAVVAFAALHSSAHGPSGGGADDPDASAMLLRFDATLPVEPPAMPSTLPWVARFDAAGRFNRTVADADAAASSNAEVIEAEVDARVISVDRAGRGVILEHGPIAALHMMGMTMRFPVRDAALVKRLKPGQRGRFRIQRTGDTLAVIGFAP